MQCSHAFVKDCCPLLSLCLSCHLHLHEVLGTASMYPQCVTPSACIVTYIHHCCQTDCIRRVLRSHLVHTHHGFKHMMHNLLNMGPASALHHRHQMVPHERALVCAQVYDALNAMGQTGWSINSTILDRLEYAYKELKGGFCGLPLHGSLDVFPVPPPLPKLFRTEAVKGQLTASVSL